MAFPLLPWTSISLWNIFLISLTSSLDIKMAMKIDLSDNEESTNLVFVYMMSFFVTFCKKRNKEQYSNIPTIKRIMNKVTNDDPHPTSSEPS